jgi:hypothetical protein
MKPSEKLLDSGVIGFWRLRELRAVGGLGVR